MLIAVINSDDLIKAMYFKNFKIVILDPTFFMYISIFPYSYQYPLAEFVHHRVKFLPIVLQELNVSG